jgi:hypothetical protein
VSEIFFKYRNEWIAAGVGVGLLILGLLLLRSLVPGLRLGGRFRRQFDRLARVHDLSGPEIRILARFGRLKFPDHPPSIFVSPSAFDAAAQAEGLKLDALRRKLFEP